MPGWFPTRLSVQASLTSWNRLGLKTVMVSCTSVPGVMAVLSEEKLLLISDSSGAIVIVTGAEAAEVL